MIASSFPTHTLNLTPSGDPAGGAGAQTASATPDVEPGSGALHSPWQPIETAPKDGTLVLLWCNFSDHSLRVLISRYMPERVVPVRRPHDPFVWQSEGGAIAERVPTHWMPLPEPPVKP